MSSDSQSLRSRIEESNVDTLTLVLAASAIAFLLVSGGIFAYSVLGGGLSQTLTTAAVVAALAGLCASLAAFGSYRFQDTADTEEESDPLDPQSAADEPPADPPAFESSDDEAGTEEVEAPADDGFGTTVNLDEERASGPESEPVVNGVVEDDAVDESEDSTDWNAMWEKARSPVAHIAALGITTIVIGFVLRWMWYSLGPIETIAGVVVFVLSAIMIPVGVMLFGPSFFGLLKTTFGKAHWFTGHLAWGESYLVETDTGWELCPGSDGKFYLDGEWETIDHGLENQTVVLGLPFGFIRHKGEDTYEEFEPDAVSSATRTDGGAAMTGGSKPGSNGQTNSESSVSSRKRAGIEEASPSLSSDDGKMSIDLVRVMSGGLLQAGDAQLIERAEYDELEDIATGSRLDGFLPILAMLFGIIFGSVMGLFMIGAFF